MPVKTKTFRVRKVYVLSEEERDAVRASRNARMERAEKELLQLHTTAGNYKTSNQLADKISKFLQAKKLLHLYQVTVEEQTSTIPCGLVFTRHASAFEAEEQSDAGLSDKKLQAVRKARAARAAQVEKQLTRLHQTAKTHKTAEALLAKARTVLERKNVSHLYELQVREEEIKVPVGVTFSRDKAALTEEQRRDGLYALLASQPKEERSANDILKLFKQQGRLEARHADCKGPLAVNPVFLKTNSRIVGLLLVLGLALLIYSLIERQARKALEPEGGLMQGLYPEGRYSRPTSKQILQKLSTRRVIHLSVAGRSRWQEVPPTPIQQQLIEMLRLPRSRDS
jgi:DNA-binding TFAR19-related protein (PDSD5 family)